MDQPPIVIAIVDDCPEDREVFKHYIEQSADQYIIDEYECAEDFLSHLSSKKLKCILLDYNLPDMNALEILHKMELGTVPVIILTGQGNEQVAASAFKHGASDYIVKSRLTSVELVNSIRLAIEKHSLTAQLKEKNEQIIFNATHDHLTNFYNRRFLESHLSKLVSKASRHKQKFGVLFVDLDKFKHVNDTLGHSIGDKLLIEFSKRIKSVLREEDIVCRIGGDEFIIVTETLVSTKDLASIAKKILEESSRKFIIESHTVNISASIGIYFYQGDEQINAEQLLSYADNALYKVKESGKNNYRFFSEDLERAYSRQLYIEKNIDIALKNKQLYLALQPQYDLSSRKVTAFEVLLRWEDSYLGSIEPTEFIPIFEDTNKIYDVSLWLMEEAKNIKIKFKELSDFIFSINISPLQLTNDNLIKDVKSIFGTTADDFAGIEFEITESGIIHSNAAPLQMLDELISLGVPLAIDDFGIGYSSIYHLSNYPFTKLKIDQSFVKNIATNKKNENIIRVISSLGKTLDMDIICEGIENKEDESVLKRIGCTTGQGFYFSKPARPEEVIKRLQ